MADDPQTVDGIPIRSEQIGFSSDELIACEQCARPNPPNRLNCFYCGKALGLPVEIAAGISFRPWEIEDWEPGVSVVVTGGLDVVDPQSIATVVSLDDESIASIADLEPPFPLFRVRPEEAREVSSRLERIGLSIESVEDGALALNKPSVRLKGMTFAEDSLAFRPFNSDGTLVVRISEIILIVVGAVITTIAESKLKKARKETKEFDEHLSSSDHSVIDIYTASDDIGFRILPHGFDFSCLGEKKSLIAAENVKVLKETLHGLIPDAVFDRSFVGKSGIIDSVWPRKVTNTSKGIERSWFGVQRGLGSTTSNEEQFTRYSRMRRKLL